eukprot:1157308-Pelagomonas_calceolata.AAC.7
MIASHQQKAGQSSGPGRGLERCGGCLLFLLRSSPHPPPWLAESYYPLGQPASTGEVRKECQIFNQKLTGSSEEPLWPSSPPCLTLLHKLITLVKRHANVGARYQPNPLLKQ